MLDNLVHIRPSMGGTPVRHFHGIVDLEETGGLEQLHPRRIIFLFGNLLHDLRGQTFFNFVDIFRFSSFRKS